MTAQAALHRIIEVRDALANGELPPFGPDQAFDDWAADLAQSILDAEDVDRHEDLLFGEAERLSVFDKAGW